MSKDKLYSIKKTDKETLEKSSQTAVSLGRTHDERKNDMHDLFQERGRLWSV